jgi:hypothetical protein
MKKKNGLKLFKEKNIFLIHRDVLDCNQFFPLGFSPGFLALDAKKDKKFWSR